MAAYCLVVDCSKTDIAASDASFDFSQVSRAWLDFATNWLLSPAASLDSASESAVMSVLAVTERAVELLADRVVLQNVARSTGALRAVADGLKALQELAASLPAPAAFDGASKAQQQAGQMTAALQHCLGVCHGAPTAKIFLLGSAQRIETFQGIDSSTLRSLRDA
eukprot:SAG31_NODE_765_length_12248_cov_6.802947_12_plen_166_part_00